MTETLTGWHGRTDDRHPTAVRDLYLAPDRDYANDRAEDGVGTVYQVTATVTNPLHLHTGADFQTMWTASKAGTTPTANFHPGTTSVVTAWLRAQGHDALVIHPSVFETDDHEQWELAAGSFGDPQTIILNPATVTAVPDDA